MQALRVHRADPQGHSPVAAHVSAEALVVGAQTIKNHAELVRISASPRLAAQRLQRGPAAQLRRRRGAGPSVGAVKVRG